MHFRFPQKVLFKHCDPAGIVFYPRIFEMINDGVEAFFDERLRWPFEVIHRTGAVPTVTMNTEFLAPSRHGEILILHLQLMGMGRSSMDFVTDARAQNAPRFRAEHRLVFVGSEGRSQPWPNAVREAATQLIEETP